MFLSYVIQNFSYQTNSLRLNVRIRASIILRNFAVIYTLLLNSTKALSSLSITLSTRRQVYTMINGSFKALTRVVFPKVKYLKYVPIGLNFPLSARYTTLSSIDNMITREKAPRLFPLLQSREYLCPYFTGIPLIITPVANRPYSLALYKFLRLSLNNWIQWPRQYRIYSHYTNLNTYWYLLRFLNKYYFKIYNI